MAVKHKKHHSSHRPKPRNHTTAAMEPAGKALWLFTPRDSWFFGNGLPFIAGEAAGQYSRFPPSPLTMQGAVRAALLAEHGVDFDQFKQGWCSVCSCPVNECALTRAVGTADNPESSELSLFGPYVANAASGEPYYPVPLDLVKAKSTARTVGSSESGGSELVRLCPGESPVLSDLGERRLPTAPSGYRVESLLEEDLLPASAFHAYLCGELPTLDQLVSLRKSLGAVGAAGTEARRKTPKTDVAVEELHVGIARNRGSHTAQEHMLYTAHHIRLNPGYALLERVKGLPEGLDRTKSVQQGRRLVRLGGESRFSFVDIRPAPAQGNTGEDVRQPLIEAIERTKVGNRLRFRLILVQAARFEHGWLPDDLNPSTWRGRLPGMEPDLPEVQLVSACLGRAVLFGGWDLVKRQPKPTQAFLPAGSVYFFETAAGEGVAEGIVKALHDRKIGLQTKAGFGHVFVGCGWV